MAVRPGDSGLEREVPSPAPGGRWVGAGNSGIPPSPRIDGEIWPPLGKAQFSYSVCSQIGVKPWSQISGWEQLETNALSVSPAVIWGSRWGHQSTGCLLH